MKVLVYWFSWKNVMDARRRLEDNGHEVIALTDIEELEENIEVYAPDVLLCHCHVTSTPNTGFERIRKLTRVVRNKLPNCIIIVTYNPRINVRWCSNVLFGGRQDHSYLFSMLGEGEGLIGYEKDFIFREDFLNNEKLHSLGLLVETTKNPK